MILVLLLSVVALAAENTGLEIVGTQLVPFAMDCLPKEAKKYIASKHRILRVEKAFDRTNSVDTLYTEIHKMDVDKTEVEKDDPCGVLQRKIYARGKLVEVAKLNPHFSYVEFEKVGYECGSSYEPFFPRFEMKIEDAPKNAEFLLSGDFSVLAGARRNQARRDFATVKNKENVPHDSALVDFFVRKSDPKIVYAVVNHSESGTEYRIYRLEKKKLVEVGVAYDPPCGS